MDADGQVGIVVGELRDLVEPLPTGDQRRGGDNAFLVALDDPHVDRMLVTGISGDHNKLDRSFR